MGRDRSCGGCGGGNRCTSRERTPSTAPHTPRPGTRVLDFDLLEVQEHELDKDAVQGELEEKDEGQAPKEQVAEEEEKKEEVSDAGLAKEEWEGQDVSVVTVHLDATRSAIDHEFTGSLDRIPPVLEAALGPTRRRLVQRIEDLLLQYDKGRHFPRPEDKKHENRNGYDRFLRGDALKEVHHLIHRYVLQGGRTGQLWKVVGGADKGGILVRSGPEFTSPTLSGRLKTGSLVEEAELQGERLSYRLLSGAGPERGWVSVLVRGGANVGGADKHLMVKTSAAAWELKHGKLETALPPRGSVVIVALMAAHISRSTRAERLRRTLDSVRRQQLYSFGDKSWGGEELVVGLSWSASTPELAATVRETVKEFVSERNRLSSGVHGVPPLTVAVEQSTRHSQFQHLRAALACVESALRDRWASSSREEQAERSLWVVFGDDDDIWHPRRIQEYARSIKSHPVLDGVGVFATNARVNCSWSTRDEDMPCTDAEVDKFLSTGRGWRLDLEENWKSWLRRYRAAGSAAYSVPLADDVGLEYFDLCPRLRLLQEFFEKTSEDILAHRYCDLRFGQFLVSYPRFGAELGLEVCFMESGTCWMYFYACAAVDNRQYEKSIEDTSEDVEGSSPTSIGIKGHMATEVPIEQEDIQLAEEVLVDFQLFESSITSSRLARYWAAFRNYMELCLLPHNAGVLDQRLFDGTVFWGVNSSFFKFAENVQNMPQWRGDKACAMMYKTGQKFAKKLARKLNVGVLWHRPAEFLEPWIEESTYPAGATSPQHLQYQTGAISPYHPKYPGGAYHPKYQPPHYVSNPYAGNGQFYPGPGGRGQPQPQAKYGQGYTGGFSSALGHSAGKGVGRSSGYPAGKHNSKFWGN